MEIGGACGTQGENITAYRCLVGAHEGKRPLGSLRNKWEGNIKTNLQKNRMWRGMDLSGSEQG
jgi:hypothetical protein